MGACGISQVSWRSIPCLCPAPRPRPSRQDLALAILSVLPPVNPNRRPQRAHNLEANTGLQHPLSTLHERRYRHPCKTRFRPAGCASTGRASNPLDHFERFQATSILLSRTSPVARVVYAKRPFGGPDAVLAYLSRYTHRIAIANSRLVAFDCEQVTFRWKDYRAKADARYKLMTLDVDEFIRRFLIHVLPDGFHRIRHYGFLASGNRTSSIALARQFLGMPDPASSSPHSDGTEGGHADEHDEWNTCPCCGGRMIIIETFEPGCQPRLWPLPSIGLDSS
ncbi:MAG TPA: transposase [Stellaceae bacterium]|nr:transposase [Stellaceae bacterium]